MPTSETHGNFTFTRTGVDGVFVVDCAAGGIDAEFVQDNQSLSVRGVLRGLHFQIEHPQAKLVRVIEGEVFDVCVDLRPGSPTFGSWEGVVLSAENRRQFFVPRGFAHGFCVLSERAIFAYKCDDVYHPNDEGGIAWDDPDLAVDWHLPEGVDPILSEKDRHHGTFAAWRAERGL